VPLIVGQVIVPLTLDLSKFTAGLATAWSQADKSAGSIARAFNAVGTAFTKMGRMWSIAITAPLTAIGKAAFTASTDFEESIAHITALVGIAREQTKAWEKDLLSMAGQVGATPKELADALYFVTSSGIETSIALDIVDQSARAAASGLGETKDVADLVTSAINAYGAANITAAQATDILVATVREGKGEIDEMTTTLGRVLPVASMLGVTFDQVGAAVAVMTRLGSTPETAATQLRQMLNAMLKPSAQAIEALGEMGMSFTELRRIIREDGLLEALLAINNLTQEFGEETIAKVFPNIRGLTGVLALLGENLEENRKVFDEIKNSAGDAGDAFAITAQTTRFKLDQAVSSLNASLITFGDTVRQVFLPVIQGIAAAVAGAVKWFSGLSDGWKRAIVVAGVLVAAIGPLLLIIGQMTLGIGGLIMAHYALHAAQMATAAGTASLAAKFLASLGTIGLVIGGILLLVLAYNALKNAAANAANTQLESFQTQREAIQQLHRERLATIEKETQTMKDAESIRYSDEKQAISDRRAALDREYDDDIQRIRDHYGYVESTTKSLVDLAREASKKRIDALEAEADAARDAHKERMEQYEEEYDAQIALLDSDTKAAIAKVQAKIDAIDAETEAEEDALEVAEDKRRVSDLKKRIADEDDADRKKELKQDLVDLEAEIERKALLKVREIQKDNYRKEIDDIKTDAQKKKDLYDEALRIRREASADQLAWELAEIETKKTAEVEALDAEIAKIQEARIAAENGAKAKQKAALDRLATEEAAAKTAHENELKRIDVEMRQDIFAEQEKTRVFLEELGKRQAAVQKLIDEGIYVPPQGAWDQSWRGSIDRKGGGMVPGVFGEPIKAVVHGGEMVLTPEQQRALMSGAVRDITMNVTYNVPNVGVAQASNADLMRRMRRLGSVLV